MIYLTILNTTSILFLRIGRRLLSGIYVETCIFCHCCSCNFRSLSEKTVAADPTQDDTPKRRQMIHAKNQPYFKNI